MGNHIACKESVASTRKVQGGVKTPQDEYLMLKEGGTSQELLSRELSGLI